MYRAFHSPRIIVDIVECQFVMQFAKLNLVSSSAISKLFILAVKFNKKMAAIYYHDYDMYNFEL